MEAVQFRTWLVCQFCGRVAPLDEDDHWLNQQHRYREEVRVVRCPQHWSEWALRHTVEGRTKGNRAAMKAALDEPPPLMPAYASPFPTMESDDPRMEVRV